MGRREHTAMAASCSLKFRKWLAISLLLASLFLGALAKPQQPEDEIVDEEYEEGEENGEDYEEGENGNGNEEGEEEEEEEEPKLEGRRPEAPQDPLKKWLNVDNRRPENPDPTIKEQNIVHESEHFDPELRYKIDNRTEVQTVNQTIPHQNLDIRNKTVIHDTQEAKLDENFHAHNRTIVHSTSRIGPNYRATKNRTIYSYSWNRTQEPDQTFEINRESAEKENKRLKEEQVLRIREEERLRQEQVIIDQRRRAEAENRIAEERRIEEERVRKEEERLLAERRDYEERQKQEQRQLEERLLQERLEEEQRLDEERRRLEAEEERLAEEEKRRKEEEARRVSFVTEPSARRPPGVPPRRRRPGLPQEATRPAGGTAAAPQPQQPSYNPNAGSIIENEIEVSEPCADYKPGDDDLQAFDFIRRFKLDVPETKYPGVVNVKGSNKMQTAYRLDKDADLRLPTRAVFPNGLPQEFSFVSTFRTRKIAKNAWSLIQLTDANNRPQFTVTLNPKRETIDFSIANYDNSLESIVFTQPQVFDKNWHKIQFSVTRDQVTLYVDCEEINAEVLEPRGAIKADGTITVSKMIDSQQTFPIDLQWMLLSCDPTRPQRETCDELPIRELNGKTCEATCPQGPPGLNGTRGTMGPPGVQGEPGLPGFPGRDGAPGKEGPIGLPGLQGPAGLNGMPGPIGPVGLPGIITREQLLAMKGERGERGEPGPPGKSFYSGDQFGIIDSADEDGFGRGNGRKGEKGDRGFDGLPGPPGPPGHTSIFGSGGSGQPGDRGAHGDRGPEGLPGLPGIPGAEGPAGQPGPQGPRGQTGQQGPPGVAGRSYTESDLRDICAAVLRDQLSELTVQFQGPPGPPGKSRAGRPGPPGLQGPPGDAGRAGYQGERGFPGIPGPPGPSGPHGPPGERGDKGDRGAEGVGLEGPVGFRGPPGPPGPEGVGLPGRQGDRGEPGRTGKPGPVGPPGPTGQCDCSSMSNYVHLIAAANAQRAQGTYKGPSVKGP